MRGCILGASLWKGKNLAGMLLDQGKSIKTKLPGPPFCQIFLTWWVFYEGIRFLGLAGLLVCLWLGALGWPPWLTGCGPWLAKIEFVYEILWVFYEWNTISGWLIAWMSGWLVWSCRSHFQVTARKSNNVLCAKIIWTRIINEIQ